MLEHEKPINLGFEVWNNVERVEGRASESASSLISQLVLSGTKKRIVTMGEPGVGKTIFNIQAGEYFTNNGLHVEHFKYDNLLSDYQLKFQKDDDNWSASEMKKFSRAILNGFRSGPSDGLQICEFPCMPGRNNLGVERERGHYALTDLNYKERDETLCLAFLTVPEIQLFASHLRSVVLNPEIREDHIEQVIASYLRVSGWNPQLNPTQRGALIRRAFSKMANPEEISKIRNEVKQFTDRPRDEAPYPFLNLDNFSPTTQHTITQSYRYFFNFTTYANLPVMILYNPKLDGPITLPASAFSG